MNVRAGHNERERRSSYGNEGDIGTEAQKPMIRMRNDERGDGGR